MGKVPQNTLPCEVGGGKSFTCWIRGIHKHKTFLPDICPPLSINNGHPYVAYTQGLYALDNVWHDQH